MVPPSPHRLAALAGAAVLVAGCGSSGSRPAKTSSPAKTTTPEVTSTPAATTTGAAPAGRRIGTTQRVRGRGATLAVTVSKVTDPLRNSGATLLPGTRVVGVKIKIANRGPGEYDSSSTGDVSVVPSSGSAAAAYAPRGGCVTGLRDFDNQISPGSSVAGCIAFSLERRARLVSIRFSADGGGAGVATWAGR